MPSLYDPYFARQPIRSEPRFIALLKKMGVCGELLISVENQ